MVDPTVRVPSEAIENGLTMASREEMDEEVRKVGLGLGFREKTSFE